MALVLQALGSDQTLDLGGLGVWLLSLTLWLNLTANDELTDLGTQMYQLPALLTHTLSITQNM